MFLRLRTTGDTGLLGPPIERFHESLPRIVRELIDQTFSYAVKGSPATVRRRLEEIVAETRADELMIAGQIFDHAARLRSFEIAAAICSEMSASAFGKEA
jgi:alkanesulfonate monooxygenase SsuD/methylene tetrahydromethanopterin reductase-like flavin-dependent oxidoreductase (luciferase family)